MQRNVEIIDHLDNLLDRVKGCRSLMEMLFEVAGNSNVPEAALGGMCALLETICRDFQAEMDAVKEAAGC